MPNTCSRKGCDKEVHAGGLCQACYRRELRRKDKESAKAQLASYLEYKFKQSDNIGIEIGGEYARLAIKLKDMLLENNILKAQTWIEENITLPVGHGYKEQRKMNFEIFPHVKFILELLDNPACKRIVLCWAAQSGKSDLMACLAAYLTGYMNRRGIYVLPTAKMFDKVRDTRLYPLLDASREKVGFDKIENKNIIRFANGNFFSLALASSPSTLAEQTGTSYVMVDEHDEFKQEGKGHNPIDLSEKRMQTSPRRLTIIGCTPKSTETGYTYYYYNRTKRFMEEIQCPLCDGWFVPDFYSHFKWPQDMDYNMIEMNNSAWVECPQCQGKITDSMHYFIVTKRKRWKDMDPYLTVAECGFREPIFLTPNKNWSSTAAAYLKSLDDPFAEADFNNSWLAKPKEDEKASRSYDMDFSRMKGNYLCARNEIPEGVYRLTGGVDVGDKEIWFILLGWGDDGRNFLIRAENIPRNPGTEGLEDAMLAATEMCNPLNYKMKGTVALKFSGGLVDSGDGGDSEAVYEFCRNHPEWKPSKGMSKDGPLHEIGRADPDNKHRGRYKGLTLYIINTNSMQSIIRSQFQNAPGSKQAFQFPEDAPEIIFDHIRNQRQYEFARKGKNSEWRWGKIGERPDHFMDALLEAKFAGSIMGLHKMKFEASAPKPQQPANRGFVEIGNIYGR
ncbi:MAG: phage terminase large subunit family protein [Fibromonadales bacterium]|nr:phage terminase large subunit family protein [Fibromonadales bacterium]